MVLCLRYKMRMAKHARFSCGGVCDFRTEFPVRRQDGVFEVVTINAIPANKLDAAMLLAIVEQEAVSVIAVAAEPPDKGIDSPALLRCDF